MPRARSLLAVLSLAAVLCGCFGPRYSRETFYEDNNTQVILRARGDGGAAFDHPATVSGVRMSHILASLDVRFDDQERKNARTPVVPLEIVYPLGDLVSRALQEAGPSEEVVVMAQTARRSMRLFTSKELTSFVVYMKNDQLYFHLSRVGWDVPKNPNERIREPTPGKEVMDFKVLASKSIMPVSRQAVAVQWRDPTFRRADAVRLAPGGRIKRRTVLFEEPEEEAPVAPSAPDLSGLSPEALRELADLEEERRRGEIGEAEYRARRARILAAGGR